MTDVSTAFWRKSSSELSEKLLSVECYMSGPCKLFDQFYRDFIGY